MRDNVDFFGRFLFELPSVREFMFIVVFLGIGLGSVSTWILSPASGLRANIVGGIAVSLFFYVVPAVLSAEVISRLGGVHRQWTYLMAVIDQIVVFLFSLTVVFADSVTESWQILWLGLATVYFINLLMVVMSRGRKRLYADLAFSLMFPGFVLIAFHVFIGRLVGIPKLLYVKNSVLFGITALLLLLTFGLYDFIIRANVRDMSVFDFTSVVILGDETRLPAGMTIDTYHQTFQVRQEDDVLTYNIPWVHPGPVAGMGGGRLTEELIDDDAFMLHVPSDHSLDLADPDDMQQFTELPDLAYHERATELYAVQRDGFTLWGRRYGGADDTGDPWTILFIQNRTVDDYDPSIIQDIKKQYRNLVLVDLHNQPVGDDYPRLQAMESRVTTLREAVDEMMERLDTADMHEYTAGFAGNREYRCLVETVNDNSTCLLGIDGNDAPPALYEAEEVLQDEFDDVLVFTTDTHKRVLELASPREYTTETLIATARNAAEHVSPASAGFGERTVTDLPVLGEEYSGLIFTLNIMARLIPITLFLYYIGIVFIIL